MIYCSDYCVSPVKLDEQSARGVASTTEAIKNVAEDVKALGTLLKLAQNDQDTIFLGAVGMRCRDYNGLKKTEQTIYNRLKKTSGIFNSYITEGDGIRKAAEKWWLVYDISSANAEKQSKQFREFVSELLQKIIKRKCSM